MSPFEIGNQRATNPFRNALIVGLCCLADPLVLGLREADGHDPAFGLALRELRPADFSRLLRLIRHFKAPVRLLLWPSSPHDCIAMASGNSLNRTDAGTLCQCADYCDLLVCVQEVCHTIQS